GFVLRTVYPEVPPKVEYSLTPRGQTLKPVIMALKVWGDENMKFRQDIETCAGESGMLSTVIQPSPATKSHS
ncbi:winged helix-turn-helix transcriptional regulator, partial [Gluconobacter albidus]